MPYVYSTATNSISYCEYGPPDRNSGHSVIRQKVVIQGGHGVAHPNRGMMAGGNVYTPMGVATQVTDDQLDFLLADANFQRHMKAGFMTYDKRKIEPEKRAAEMELKDGSAPLTPDDFVESENSAPGTKILKRKESGNDELIPLAPKHKSKK